MSRPDLLDIARARRAVPRGDGEQVEAYVVRTRETDVEVFDGEVESLTTASVEGVGIRVIAGQRQGLAWAGSLDADVIDETLQEARDNAGFGEPDEWYGLASPADVNGVAAPALDLWRDELASVPTDEKVRIALELERATKAADPRIRNVESASYGDALVGVGARELARRRSAHAPHDVLRVGGRARRRRHRARRRATDSSPAARSPTSTSTRSRATRPTRACRLLGAKPTPGRRIPVILDPLVTRSVLGVLSSAFNGESMLKGRSLFAGRGRRAGRARRSCSSIDDPTDAACARRGAVRRRRHADPAQRARSSTA